MKLASFFLIAAMGISALAQSAPANDAAAAEMTMQKPIDEAGIRSSLMINPKSRASDFKQAYDVLRREKTSQKVFFQLAGGETIANVIDVMIMENGTIIVFRFNTPQGVKLQAVPVEDVVGVSYFSS